MIEDAKLTRFFLKLTARQRDVLELTCTGMSNDDIATCLYIVASSVADHLSSIYDELRTVEGIPSHRAARPLVISLFAPYFHRHPELRNPDLGCR